MTTRKLLLPAVLLFSTPAAAELPAPVRDMIDAAIATGDRAKVETIIEIARSTNPDDAGALDALLQDFVEGDEQRAALAAAEEAAKIRAAGLLQNWSGEGQIGAFQSSGNTDSVGVTTSLALKREGIRWSHRMRAAMDYQRTNGVTSREQFQLSYEPRFQINDRLFAFGLTQFERDRFQGFSARYSASGGLGYRIIDRDNLHLSVKAGPAYRQTEFVDGTSTSNIAGLVGVDFDWQIADNIKLTQDTNAVAEGGGEAMVFIDSDNTSLSVITGLEAKLNSALTARLSYAVEYDSNPPAGAVKTDTLTRFTLVYGF